MDLLVLAEGQLMPTSIRDQVVGLFIASYHRYHYLDELDGTDRIRIVALDEGGVTGFASFEIIGDYAHLANLLVASSMRGAGYGRVIERARLAEVRARGKRCYVSCTCDTLASQRLKLEIGLVPVCVRFGYRVGVAAPDRVGSAVVFSEGPIEVSTSPRWAVENHTRHGRIRWLASSAAKLADLELYGDDKYVELLVGPELLQDLRADNGFALSGRDLDSRTGHWYYCFQLKNERYRRGIAEQPQMVVNIPELRRRTLSSELETPVPWPR